MKEILRLQIEEALKTLQGEGKLPEGSLPAIALERPKDDQFGEYTSNIALILGKQMGKNPKEIAEHTRERLTTSNEQGILEKIEVAGPGHLNFYLSQKALGAVLEKVLEEKEKYGDSKLGAGKKVNNEFISANPTGPLHLGNARGGFFADTLSRVLRKTGFEVINEYYINNAGEQVIKLAHSVLGDEEAVYAGEYIEELKKRMSGEFSKPLSTVGSLASDIILEEHIKPTVQLKMKISFDVWTSEQKLFDDGLVDEAIEKLKSAGVTLEKDGALWLRSSEKGDDKDRVLIKADGKKTYLASDAGHILGYLRNNVDAILETFGADHHGYTKRFEIVARALGFKGDIHFTLVQLVKVVKEGKEVKMSKREGNVVAIDDLLELVGVDVARFFFLMYAPGTHMNFDLGLAQEHSAKNPVFYVQYAHARLASILRKAEEENLETRNGDYTLLTHPKERELMRELLAFPELVETVATEYSVQKLPQFAMRLSDKLHSFYDQCQVINKDGKELSQARLGLISAVKIVLGNTLALMGISAPERM